MSPPVASRERWRGPGHRAIPRPVGLTLSLLAFLCALASTWTAVRVGGTQLSDLLMVLWALAIAVAGTARARAAAVLPGWVWLPAVGAVAALTLQVTTSPSRGYQLAADLELLARLTAATVLVPLLIVASARLWPSSLRATIVGWAASVACSVVAQLHVDTGGALPVAQHELLSPRGFGLTLHPNSFGLGCVLVLPFVLAGIRSKGPIPAVLAVPFTALTAVGLVSADSRSALAVALVVTVLALAYLLTSARMWPIGLPFLLVAGAVSLIWLPGALNATRLAEGAAVESDALRSLQRQEAWQRVAQSPLFGDRVAEVGNGVMTLLGLLVAGGVIMAVAYYAYFAAALTTLVRLARAGDLLAGLSLISALSFLAVGLAQPTTVERYTFWPVGIGLAVSAAVRWGPGDASDGRRGPRRRQAGLRPLGVPSAADRRRQAEMPSANLAAIASTE